VDGALLDRDSELAALSSSLAAAHRGRGRLVLVCGPAGIGKSSLLAAAAAEARADGMTVLRARAGPLERDAAWGVARQLFDPLRASPEWDELAVGAAALAARALDASPAEPATGGDAMHAAARGLFWLASNLAGRGPTLIVVDDVHWADAPSLRWLAQLAHSLDGLPLALLCAVRAGEPAAPPELLAELLAATAEAPLRPRALGPAAVAALVRERLPDAHPAFADACHAVTAGNPFLLTALLGQLAADGVTPTAEVAARLSAFGPEQVARSVDRQLARLPGGADALARAVALLGRGAALRDAAAVAGLGMAEAARLADALRATGLLEDRDELALVHPLVEHALYTSLGRGERTLWHARAARLLDGERGALHLLHTEPAGDSGTVAALRAAAARASARGAPQTAAALLRRALAEPPPDAGSEADLRLALGLALAAYMQPEAPAVLQEAVERAASPEQRCELALRGARALGLAGYFMAAAELCRRALADPGAASPEAMSRLEAELVTCARLQVVTQPEADARLRRPVVDPPVLDLWRVNAAWALNLAGESADEVMSLLRPYLEHPRRPEDADSLTGTVATVILIANDELDAGLARADALTELARPRGWMILLVHGSMWRAQALVRAGRARDAEPDARLAFDYKLGVSPTPAMMWSLTFLVDALVELGELDDADAALAAAGEPPPGALAAPLALQARARLRLAQHRPAEAHADATHAAARWLELGVRHPVFASWRVDAVEALVRLGDVVAARELAVEQLRLADRLGTSGARGAALRTLARTAPADERLRLLDAATGLLAGSPAQLEHARALVDLGAALRRANHRAEAREPLRRALDLAERGGLRLLADRTREELRAAGAKPRRAALQGLEALTAAEHRVATLAADGLSNREIAEQLYVTQRTVETHLTHAFQKLGIAARAQLATLLGERELVASP
jgi:DNA-binding CsgD family transcriptional regulator